MSSDPTSKTIVIFCHISIIFMSKLLLVEITRTESTVYLFIRFYGQSLNFVEKVKLKNHDNSNNNNNNNNNKRNLWHKKQTLKEWFYDCIEYLIVG